MKKPIMDRVFDILSEETKRHARLQSGEKRAPTLREKADAPLKDPMQRGENDRSFKALADA